MNLPKLTRGMILLSLLYLALGFSFGGILLSHKGAPLHPAVWRLLPAHVDFLLLGWLTQLTLAAAYWIFPRFRTPPQRGSVLRHGLEVAAFNLGLWMTALSPLLDPNPTWLALTGRTLQTAGLAFFSLDLWRRIRPYQR